ncbi:MAG: Gfo/Idh/MocA family oxidoreductase [Candidatus Omnitrophica bacterium]|nr:Gfo/Idh/MocA family oxidoreductase [Candidatus Omnitrophota bacterium]
MKNGKYLVGVIGAGGIGRYHIDGWKKLPDVVVYGIADTNATTLETVSKQYEIPVAVKDYKNLIKIEEIDIIDVCTPNSFHYPVTIAALKNGKHVLCEKPLATKSEHVKKMIQAAKENKRKLMAAQNQRFSYAGKMTKKIIDDGELGEIYFAQCYAVRRRELPPSDTFIKKELSGGGPMFDIGVHILDIVYWFMGCPKVHSVKGVMFTKLARNKGITGTWGQWDPEKYEVEDFAAGFVLFKDGRALQLTCSFLSNLPSNWSASLYGTKAGMIWPEMKLFSELSGMHRDSTLTPIVPEKEPSHHIEIKEFLDCVKTGKDVLVKPEESLEVIGILESMYISHEKKKEVIFQG